MGDWDEEQDECWLEPAEPGSPVWESEHRTNQKKPVIQAWSPRLMPKQEAKDCPKCGGTGLVLKSWVGAEDSHILATAIECPTCHGTGEEVSGV